MPTDLRERVARAIRRGLDECSGSELWLDEEMAAADARYADLEAIAVLASSELRDALDRIAELEAEVKRWETNSVHTCHEECPRIACVQRRRIAALEAERDAANSVKVGDMMGALYSTYLSLTADGSYDAIRYIPQKFWREMAIAAIDKARGVTK
jgi:hypothetical protein